VRVVEVVWVGGWKTEWGGWAVDGRGFGKGDLF